jgi:hypothetical protein
VPNDSARGVDTSIAAVNARRFPGSVCAGLDGPLEARAAGAGSEIQLPVESMTVVLKVTATRSVDGKAGFKVPVVELELGGGAGRERGSEQTVTVVFGGPVDRDGRPVPVAQESAQRKG